MICVPDKKRVYELFDYVNGNLVRKVAVGNVKIGDVAGSKTRRGYIIVGIDGKHYMAHRLVYLMHYGYVPKHIDHRDRNKHNNKIENLRPCTKPQNGWNSLTPTTNTSGIKGILWVKDRKKWEAKLSTSKGVQRCGQFNSLADAKKAIETAREKFHGEFACHGE